jgi:cationic peptide transport system ATP-binding protein
MATPLIDIKNLTLEIDTAQGYIKALDKVSITIPKNDIRALIGESGSGKSLIVKAIVGALPNKWKITADRMSWKGTDLLALSDNQRRKLIHENISVIFQNPSETLDPTVKLSEQIFEAIPDREIGKGWFWQRNHRRKQIAIQYLHKVGIKDHDACLNSYSHQLPDDVCQKFMIASALAARPRLLIADDPTKAMGVSNKSQIIQLLRRLNQTKDVSILFVSHDLLSIFSIANSVSVLYCGQTIESGQLSRIMKRPLHPYTKALLDSAPSFNAALPKKTPLSALEGTIPALQHLPIGCRLGPRCPRAGKECVKMPEERRIHEHRYRCHFPLHWGKL